MARHTCLAISYNFMTSHNLMKKKYPPGDLAIWIFILAELLAFGVLFIAYVIAKHNHLEIFSQYQLTLDKGAALINTLALIAASFFVVLSVTAIKESRNRHSLFFMALACLMAVVFILVKSSEFSYHFSHGVSLSTNVFYTFYLSLTVFHFFHVVMGLIILLAIAVKLAKDGYSEKDHTGMESGASYWHMVDVVWLVLFPIVYVM